MSDLVLANMGQYADSLSAFLNSAFEIKAYSAGSDLIISEMNAARAFAPRAYLGISRQIKLKRGNESEIASELYGLISEEMKGFQETAPRPENVKIPGNLGILSEIARANTQLAVQTEKYVPRDLATVISVMREKVRAKYVTGVTINAALFQTHLSFAKMALLAGLYEIADVKDLVFSKDALARVLPTGLDPIYYLDTLTKFSPVALTLPVHRADLACHFQGDGMWIFPAAAANGLMAEFIPAINPLAEKSDFFGLQGLRDMGEANIWRFLRLVVEGLNKLISYTVDPRNFVDAASGKVDFLRQIQTHSAIHLLFADITALSFSTAAHQRISFAMSALDKLANLRVNLGGATGPDSDSFKRLCCRSQRDELIRLYTTRCAAMNYEHLASALSQTVTLCYDELHSYLGQQDTEAKSSEATRLVRLWSQRNVRHGTFLLRNQFENLFLESHGNIPTTIGSLPFLLVLGILFDPKSFFSFEPAIQD